MAGLSVAEIARLFLVTDTTMSARITRAKRTIVDAGIPFAVPTADQMTERLDTVLTVIYLIFTEGYRATSGPQLIRAELAKEAIRLATVVNELVTDQPAVPALLALMMLQHSRRDSRVGPEGRVILLPDQDRGAWHHDEIADGLRHLDSSMAGDPDQHAERVALRFRLQALIAASHATAATAADTDWATIAAHYAELDDLTKSPIVRLNRAVAVAEAVDQPLGWRSLMVLTATCPAAIRSRRRAVNCCTGSADHASPSSSSTERSSWSRPMPNALISWLAASRRPTPRTIGQRRSDIVAPC